MTSSANRAVDRLLALVARRFGVGRGTAAPGWVRARVAGVLAVHAARRGIGEEAAAERLEQDRGALEELVTALRVGETRFYRDRALWQALEKIVVPSLSGGGPLRALSAGCSTGEEAYTLAMLLSSARRRYEVVGVDRSPEALAAARAGVYEQVAARDLPAPWSSRWLEARGESLHVKRDLAEHVTFEELDLCLKAPRGPFHVVVFKNVLVYLTAAIGEGASRRLAAELTDDGLLFVAASEVPRMRKAGLDPVRVAQGVTAFRRR